MAQSLKSIIVLAEDPDSVISIHMAAPINLTRVPPSSHFHSDQILSGAHKRIQANIQMKNKINKPCLKDKSYLGKHIFSALSEILNKKNKVTYIYSAILSLM